MCSFCLANDDIELQKYESITLPMELNEVLVEYEEAWNTGNAKKLADLFVEDAFVLANKAPPIRGKIKIEEYYSQEGGALSFRAFSYGMDENIAFIIGGIAKEKGATDLAKFTITLRKIRDKWKIFSDMDNSNRSKK